MRTALIDGDVLKYVAGFACQKDIYTHKPTGEWFEGKTAAKNWLKIQDGGTEESKWNKALWIEDDWDMEIKVEPWSNCEFILRNKLAECMNANNCDEMKIFFTPKTTFRHQIAFTRVYKGNRTPHRPEYASEIVSFLLDNFDCETGEGIEADDLLGLHQTTDTVICTNDKDLMMIPGEHYNLAPKKQEDIDNPHTLVDMFDADRWFFVQLLAGDSTDNIQGIPGIGVGKAEKIVDSFDGDIESLREEIKELYNYHYETIGQDVMEEHAALVWILRKGEIPETAGWRRLLNV